MSAERKGRVEVMLAGLEPTKGPADLAAIPANRWLAGMSRAIFQAGFNWTAVDRMWSGMETAFQGFDPGWCAHIEEARLDALLADCSIGRHGAKVRAMAENARFVNGMDGLGTWVGSFGSDRFAELLVASKTDGSRLDGTTAQYFLRFQGVDGWTLSPDVSARLVAKGVVEGVTPSPVGRLMRSRRRSRNGGRTRVIH
ncbi:MAG: DNA-3-methyladenine glycosylase I [Pseudomonadota bacterium]